MTAVPPRPDGKALRQLLRLYLVTDSGLCRMPLADVVGAAVAAGVTCVQLREKHLPKRDVLAQALVLKALLAPFRVPLVVNDHIDIALACGAEGIHLGQGDISPETARALLPPHVFIGWSVESEGDVQRAASLPVDYLGISPVFSTPTKVDTKAPWGLEGLKTARGMTLAPLVAIGGVNGSNAHAVLQAGADGLAVVSAICASETPGNATRALLAAMASA